MKWVIGVVAALVVMCMGLCASGGLWWYFESSKSAVALPEDFGAQAVEQVPVVEPVAVFEPVPVEPPPPVQPAPVAPAPAPAASSTKPTATPVSSADSTPKSPKPAPPPPPAAAPAPSASTKSAPVQEPDEPPPEVDTTVAVGFVLPSGAKWDDLKVSVDGKSLGKRPLRTRVTPGLHTFTFRGEEVDLSCPIDVGASGRTIILDQKKKACPAKSS